MTTKIAALVLTTGVLALAAGTQAATVYDNFTLVQWTVTRIGIGPIVHEANERLEVALPSWAREGASADYFRGGYQSKCLLRGDFDVQTTFALLRYAPGNGVRAGLDFDNKFAVERISFGPNDTPAGADAYLTHGDSILFTPTTDRWGKLRAVRQGGIISGYYFDTASRSWQFIGSSTITNEDLHFRVSIWSHDYYFADRFTKVAFDNVIVNSGTLVGAVCPFTK
jgi:hypothetical protein